jgi:hypothetical protein
MIYSRSQYTEPAPRARAPISMRPMATESDDTSPPPRWGLLAAAVVAALLTASWIGGELETAESDIPQAHSAQTSGK